MESVRIADNLQKTDAKDNLKNAHNGELPKLAPYHEDLEQKSGAGDSAQNPYLNKVKF